MKIRHNLAARFAVFLVFTFLCSLYTPGTLVAREWKQASELRLWSFPRDHGSHGEYRTEWWYFTGNLTNSQGNRYGYQLTFFRYGLALGSKNASKPWSVRDIYLAHFAITDVTNGTFRYRDRVSRKGPGLAGSAGDAMNVHVLNWSALMRDGRIILKAAHDGMELALSLTPAKPLVLHGRQGLSRKGPLPGQASYYYSFTDLRTEGTLRSPGMKGPVAVRGISWFDQEFGSNQLSQEQAGWDWFALHLSDGRDLMVYYLRKKDGTMEKESSGTLVEPDSASRHLTLSAIDTTILAYWKSVKTAGRYPAAWRIRVPAAAIDVTIAPLVADQELVNTASTGITYWEGAVDGKGTSQGKEVTVEGYVELTGYAGTLGGKF
ncbi:MAG: lipocalin-like domain-containing protein [Syntrophorhabdaceae bacterium]|nr:lipocalin-like domain-containing protein [Syntrophorhabdaceae bacterium]